MNNSVRRLGTVATLSVACKYGVDNIKSDQEFPARVEVVFSSVAVARCLILETPAASFPDL